jgi:hypothetical protein
MTYRVFLSSTFSDLASHRAAVQSAVRRLGAVDVSMEHFGARDQWPVEECIRLVRHESDVFVGIYAHRYGYVPDGSSMSISESEYRAASEASLPRFIYLIDERHAWPVTEVDVDLARERLVAFKASLLKRHMCQPFGSQDQLAAQVAADVGRHMAMTASPKVSRNIPIEPIGLESMSGDVTETPDEWNKRRNGIYTANGDVFLTHVVRPSKKPGQEFDVFIYLMRHNSTDLQDVQLAEFFMGKYWGNRVFPAVPRNGFIGIATAAYGTFLCLCRVTFTSGESIYLHRYIDFESQRMGA